MNKIFDSARESKPKMSAFDLSHERKLSANFGKLYPCLVQPTMPGDQFSCNSETLIRMVPMASPVMERFDTYIHYFFVPHRITWPLSEQGGFENYITGGSNNGSPVPDTLPIADPSVLVENPLTVGSLADHLGVPPVDTLGESVVELNALPFRAYHKIYNDWFRDENLQEAEDYSPSDPEYWQLHTRSWEKDYFTSAFTSPQKGAAVELPIEASFQPEYVEPSLVKHGLSNPQDGNMIMDGGTVIDGAGDPVSIENLEPEQTVTTSVIIEDLRRLNALQRFLEISQRAGTRLVELTLSIFGVHTGDHRVDRAEYLGGGKTPITISEVLNTTGTEDAPQGAMAGHGISVGARNNFSYKCKDHGYIIGIMSILPKPAYKQGLPRHFFIRDRFDFPWPQFAHLGEQAVENREIFMSGTDDGQNQSTFGYQQRYAEYKYAPNTVHGQFRTTLDFWTVCRDFDALPNLNSDFIVCDDENLQDIFAVTDPEEDKFLIQMYHNLKARRPLPFFANPSL